MKFLFLKLVMFKIFILTYIDCNSINLQRIHAVNSRTFQVTENPIENDFITPKSDYRYNKSPVPLIQPDSNHLYEVNNYPVTSVNDDDASLKYNSGLIALMINTLLKLYTIQKDGRFTNDIRRNSPELLPSDPYIELLLSHYGKYLPKFTGSPKHLYSHIAVNNLHNNQPFGSYKYVQDRND